MISRAPLPILLALIFSGERIDTMRAASGAAHVFNDPNKGAVYEAHSQKFLFMQFHPLFSSHRPPFSAKFGLKEQNPIWEQL